MNTNSTKERPEDNAYNIQRRHSLSQTSADRPCSNSSSPIDNSSPSEMDYVRATRAEHSRRFLRELDEAPGGNNLQYILKCPYIPFFGNQGLHNEIRLEGNMS